MVVVPNSGVVLSGLRSSGSVYYYYQLRWSLDMRKEIRYRFALHIDYAAGRIRS
jgi:hypothetical protein